MLILWWLQSLGLYAPVFAHTHPQRTAPSFDSRTAEASLSSLPAWITFAGHVEVETEGQKNFDLDTEQDDDLVMLTPELSLEISIAPTTYLEAFFRLEPSLEVVMSEDQEREESRSRFAPNLRDAFILLRLSHNGRFALQIGRQTFEEDRQWLYNHELDAARMIYQQKRLRFTLAIGRGSIINTDSSIYALIYGEYAFAQINIAVYSIARDVFTSMDERPVFFGVRSQGRITEALEYWLDLSHVRGKEASRPIRAWGLDAGMVYSLDVFLEPSLIVAYAFGSGDGEPVGRVDSNFRQTGLQENETDLQSVVDIKYYGALFDPELSNLHVFTLGIGITPFPTVSGHVMVHYYLQHQASSEFRDVGISAAPTGLSRHLVDRFVNSYKVISTFRSGASDAIARSRHYRARQKTYNGLTKCCTRYRHGLFVW